MSSTLTGDAATIATFLKRYNLTDAQIAGILGNIQQESGFKPLAPTWDVNGYSGGIVQWHNGRLTNLENFVAKRGGTGVGTVEQELAYLDTELQGDYAGALSAVKQTSTPSAAAQAWNKHFEGGTDPGGIREKNADALYPEVSGVTNQSGVINVPGGGLLTGAAGALGGGLDAIRNAGKIIGTSPSSIFGAGGDALTAISAPLIWLNNPQNLLRLAYFVVGALLVVVGGSKLIGQPNPVMPGVNLLRGK